MSINPINTSSYFSNLNNRTTEPSQDTLNSRVFGDFNFESEQPVTNTDTSYLPNFNNTDSPFAFDQAGQENLVLAANEIYRLPTDLPSDVEPYDEGGLYRSIMRDSFVDGINNHFFPDDKEL